MKIHDHKPECLFRLMLPRTISKYSQLMMIFLTFGKNTSNKNEITDQLIPAREPGLAAFLMGLFLLAVRW